MNKASTLLAGLLVLLVACVSAQAQRPRTVQTTDTANNSTTANTPPLAPQTIKVKYEGGVFGQDKKIDGTITFLMTQAIGLSSATRTSKRSSRFLTSQSSRPLQT